jgi:hypothetical protein
MFLLLLSERPSTARRARETNPYVWVPVLFTMLGLAVLMTWPALARIFGLRPPPAACM